MKKSYKPEDIEQLLKEKSFNELLNEERSFVLDHMESGEEYQRMRSLIGKIENESWNDTYEAPKDLRNNLINLHKKKNKRSFTIWLNSFFLGGDEPIPWFKSRVTQWSVACMLVIGAIFFVSNYDNSKTDSQLAQNKEIEDKQQKHDTNFKEKKVAPKNEELAEDKSVTGNASISQNGSQTTIEASDQAIETGDNELDEEILHEEMDEITFTNVIADDMLEPPMPILEDIVLEEAEVLSIDKAEITDNANFKSESDSQELKEREKRKANEIESAPSGVNVIPPVAAKPENASIRATADRMDDKFIADEEDNWGNATKSVSLSKQPDIIDNLYRAY